MVLSETELVGSLLCSQSYLDTITGELLPDDTMDLCNGSRKGKSEVKYYDHIEGVSNIHSKQMAKQQRQRAVIAIKQS